MGISIIMTGRQCGRLLVLGPAQHPTSRGAHWLCQCECGNQTIVVGTDLRRGRTLSCGCYGREKAVTHGHSRKGRRTPTYVAWENMKCRCLNPKSTYFHMYGGRGVQLCDRWNPKAGGSFENFLEDMGPRPDGMELDKDIRGGIGCLLYSPETCCWAPRKEQTRHTRWNRMLTLDGQTYCLVEWAERSGVPAYVIKQRLDKLGWDLRRALETPVRKMRPRQPKAAA